MISTHGSILTFILFIGFIECGQWKYKGPTGPGSWHELFPTACAGTAQSPIDIKPEMTMYDPELKDFAIFYDPPKPGSTMFVKNNGHAIQVDTDGEFYVTNGGLHNIYKVAQFHFHWGSEDHMGSEHLLNSIAYPIEMHIVTYNSDLYGDIATAVTKKGGLAVLGVLFEVQEEPNKIYGPIIKALEHVKNPEESKTLEIEPLSLRNLLPDDISKYYRYNGSLTTPGCFETVTWTVFHQKQKISFGQLMKFRRVLQHRHRKHKKHHKRSTRRRLVRAAEEGAKAVLEEIGIKNDPVQKGELISTLVNQQNKEIPKPEPTHDGHGMMHHEPDIVGVAVDEESAKRAEESMVQYSKRLNESRTGHHMPRQPPIINEEPLWVQENLVDNFRPVQPLNNRIVYRSFKLKDIYAEKPVYRVANEAKPNPGQNKPALATAYSKQNKYNSANSVHISISSFIFVFILSFL